MGNDLLICSIHQIEQASFLVKIGSVINNVFNQRTVEVPGRRSLFKPVILNALKFAFTEPGELTETSDGITFNDP